VNPFASPRPVETPLNSGRPPRIAYAISLRVLMGVITVIAISLAIGVRWPGLGIVIGLLATPALVRTAWAMNRRRLAGAVVTGDERLAAFVASLGVMAVTLLAACIAFTILCFPLGVVAFNYGTNDFLALGIVIGVLAAGGIAFFILRKLGSLRYYDRPRDPPAEPPN
jgi:hypothetical protein